MVNPITTCHTVTNSRKKHDRTERRLDIECRQATAATVKDDSNKTDINMNIIDPTDWEGKDRAITKSPILCKPTKISRMDKCWEKRYKRINCSVCDKRMSTIHMLELHMKNTHACWECCQCFGDLSQLQTHECWALKPTGYIESGPVV